MKKIVFSLLLLIAVFYAADCSTIRKVTRSEIGEKLRLIIETDAPVKYTTAKGNNFFALNMPKTRIKAGVPTAFQSMIVDGVRIEQQGEDCVLSANFKYLTSSNVMALKSPNRLVIDLRKISKMTLPKEGVPEIAKIETRSLPDKFKVVIYLTAFVPYKIYTSEAGIILELPDTNSVIKSRKIITKDKLITKVAVDQVDRSVLVSISQNYPSFYQIYKQESPPSLVIEFDKTSKATVSQKNYSEAIKYSKFIKGTEEGPSTVNCIIIDQRSLEVFPFMAKDTITSGPNLFEMIGGIFSLWSPKEEVIYRRERVSKMAAETGSIAGVNGTYFGSAGEPLGVLMINGELVSYSINDRTALIIDKNNSCYIDNVGLAGEATLEGYTIQISGINKKRNAGEAVLYTSRYGGQTNEDSPGIILSVVGTEIKNISRARGWVPNNGYALSLDQSYYENLGEKVRAGNRIYLNLRLIPFSGMSSFDIKHVIGGGPRLLKSEQIYISKNSEQFKSDIAKSRTSRTAVGIKKDGALVFITVDKNKANEKTQKSVGVTLEELAQIMKEVGCVDAMNLDGGSSSTMVVSGEVVNYPSSGSEINVSNGIMIR